MRRFKLFSAPLHPRPLTISGAVGAKPDTDLYPGGDTCRRSELPVHLRHLTFTSCEMGTEDTLKNFYHLGEFFIVSESMRSFLVSKLGEIFRAERVDIRHRSGKLPDEPYFAVKVIRTIDCVDPDSSFKVVSFVTQALRSFSDSKTEYELTDSLKPEFANTDRGTYLSYPEYHYQIRTVRLIEDRIPADALLFRPKFWPGQLIIDTTFIEVLAAACRGGAMGYYFWAFDLDDVAGSQNQTSRELR